MTPSPTAPKRTWRPKRIVAGIAGFLLAAAAGLMLLAVLLLHDLARPWVKRRVVARAAAAGVDLDYREARVELFSGLHLSGLVVQTPGALRGAAPELLRLGSLDVQWTVSSLLSGAQRIQRVSVRDLELTLVTDERGQSSLGLLAGPPKSAAKPAAPGPGLSHQLASLLANPPPVGEVEIANVALTSLRVRDGKVVDRIAVRGLSAELASRRVDGAWALDANLGKPPAPLTVTIHRDGELATADAELALRFLTTLTPARAHAELSLDVVRQTFKPEVKLQHAVHTEATVAFDTEHGRLAVDLGHTELADDAATLQGQLVLPDAAPPALNAATLDVNLAKLIQAVPAEWVPLSLTTGTVHAELHDLDLSDAPRFTQRGGLRLEAEIASLRVPASKLALDHAKLSAKASPETEGALAANVALAIDGLRLDGPTTLAISHGHVELATRHLRPALSALQKVTGDAELRAAFDSLEARSARGGSTATKLTLHVHAPLPEKAPFAAQVELIADTLQASAGKKRFRGPVRLALEASDVTPDAADSRRSRARVQLNADVAGAHATIDATKGADELAYALGLDAPGLGFVQPLLSPNLADRAPWAQMALALKSKGKAANLFSSAPQLEEQTTLDLTRPAWAALASAQKVSLALRSKGDARRHHAELELQTDGLRVHGKEAGPQHLVLQLDADRQRPSVHLQLATQAGPKIALDAALAWANHSLHADVRAELAQLGAVAPLLEGPLPGGLDLAPLAAKLELRGDLTGAVTGFTREGTPVLSPTPLRTAAFEGQAHLHASGLRGEQGANEFDIPSVELTAESHAGPSRKLHALLEVPSLHAASGEHDFDVTGAKDELSVTAKGDLTKADVELTERLEIAALEQDAAPYYPIRELALSFSARRDSTGLIDISTAQLTNGGTATGLQLHGSLDMSYTRHRLALEGQLDQDLASLHVPGRFEGHGKASLSFRVSSPDLRLFRTRADLAMQGVHVELPDKGVVLDRVDGDLPVSENLTYSGGQAHLVHETNVNLYSLLRFADQHALLSRSGYVSIGSIDTPMLKAAPLAGNLSVDQNVVSMSQLEMGIRGGRITGDCVVDYQGLRSTLRAHVRATGVQSSHGEPFDGNAALVVSAADRSIDGRAEILRIGKQHLQDLLDLQDPHRTNPAMNRVRYALTLGYPDHVRISLDHGFASMTITMGGLASLISIDPVRGIPIGPLVDRAMGSMKLPQEKP